MNKNGNKLIESYSNLIGEKIITNSDEYAKIKLTEKVLNQRRIDLEESINNTSLNSSEFIQLQEKLSNKGYFKDSFYLHLKKQIKYNDRCFIRQSIIEAHWVKTEMQRLLPGLTCFSSIDLESPVKWIPRVTK